MEDENEKMEALKKAYAEIILNTSKEAAARVMASERNARQFEHDLQATKEEASRMLLRLKQMLDAKTAAAEITYLNQKNKIEVLESQLNEAEGLIVDLRVELQQAEKQLDEVKKHNIHILDRSFEIGHMTFSGRMPFEKNLTEFGPFIASTEFGTRLLTSDAKTPSSDVNIIHHKSCMSSEQTVIPYLGHENYIMNDHVLATLRSIEPELYINGCTQGICAIERTGDERGLPEDGPHVPIKREDAIKLNEPSMKERKMSSSKTVRFNAVGNFSGFKATFAKGSEDFALNFCKNRKRKSQHGKSKFSSCTSRCCQCMRSKQSTSAISHLKSSSCTCCTLSCVKKSNAGFAKSSSEVVQIMQADKNQAVSVVRRSLRKRKAKQLDDFMVSCRGQGSHSHKSRESSQPCLYPSRHKTNLVGCNAESGLLDIHSTTGLMDVTTHMREDKESTVVEDTKTGSSELIDKSVVVKEEGYASKFELGNVSLTGLHMSSKTKDDAPSQTQSNRLFKYTFCRKRKKSSLIDPDENSPVGESSRKRRFGEKQKIASGPLGSMMSTETSNHSRRVLQIARQLTSLSGRK